MTHRAKTFLRAPDQPKSVGILRRVGVACLAGGMVTGAGLLATGSVVLLAALLASGFASLMSFNVADGISVNYNFRLNQQRSSAAIARRGAGGERQRLEAVPLTKRSAQKIEPGPGANEIIQHRGSDALGHG